MVPRIDFLGDVPDEIWLLIASFMRLRDIICLRLTCRKLHSLTQDQLLWLRLLQGLADTEPLPPLATQILKSGAGPDGIHVEELCRFVHHTEKTWIETRSKPWSLTVRENSDPRSTTPQALNDNSALTLMSLNVFKDRWLLIVYREALMELWDLYPELSSKANVSALNCPRYDAICRARTQHHNLAYGTSCAAVLTDDDNALLVGVTSEPNVTIVLRFSLDFRDRNYVGSEVVATFSTPSPTHLLRAILPNSSVLVYSRSQVISIVHMETHQEWNVGDDEGEEALWNGVIGAIPIADQHLLCVKTRSVELMTRLQPDGSLSDILSRSSSTPAEWNQTASIVRHEFSETSFRSVSIADPSISLDADGNSVLNITFLAFDVLNGLYQYRATANLPSLSDMPLHMEVQLIGVHQMAQTIPLTDQLEGVRRTRSGFTQGSRAFVSACCLGAQGKRGIWVERQRNSVKRAVYGYKVNSERVDEGSPGQRYITGQCIYEVSSFDLRDDLTHCAFAESTGLVVLGTRNGEVLLI